MDAILTWWPFAAIVLTGIGLIATIGYTGHRLTRWLDGRESAFVRPIDRRLLACLIGGSFAAGFVMVGQPAVGVALGVLLAAIWLQAQPRTDQRS